MNRLKAREITEALLEKHGLRKEGWTVMFNDTPSRRLGCCRHGVRIIELTGWYVDQNTSAHILDTIRHEVAHALAGYHAGHGHTWKKWAKKLGATPKARSKSDIVPKETRFIATCGSCGTSHRRSTLPKAGVVHWCRCQRPMKQADRLTLKWEHNPNYKAAKAAAKKVSLPDKQGVKKPKALIASLLKQLAKETDKVERKRIRRQLRKLGHKGGLRNS